MPKPEGIIVILSYPDTVVRPAYWERMSGFWPKIGIGGKHAVQAGHAALLLIKKGASEIKYFDFGRYITSYGNGRVRSLETDPEVFVPIKAVFKEEKLTNINEILLWLDNNPDKTHGEGRLVASINDEIEYDNALTFINDLIHTKEIPYGAFLKNGSNCARFVTDTIVASCKNLKIKLKLKSSYMLTPSPIGNVFKGKTIPEVYEVENQEISMYQNRSILKEYNAAFFNKFDNELNLKGTELPNTDVFNLLSGTWLSGIGIGAWFKIEEKLDSEKYRISRHTVNGVKDFESEFLIDITTFNFDDAYQFIHPTNCKEMYVVQNGQEYHFKLL
jgi:hypothetical protein